MAGAAMRRSTLPAQYGHFFKCGPETLSIFSVFRPQLKHLYSYKGTDSPPIRHPKRKVYHCFRDGPSRADYWVVGQFPISGLIRSWRKDKKKYESTISARSIGCSLLLG